MTMLIVIGMPNVSENCIVQHARFFFNFVISIYRDILGDISGLIYT